MNPQLRAKINKNFVVRVTDATGTRIRGAGMLWKEVGHEWANKLAGDALLSQVTIYTKKLRRGIKIEFHSK